MNNISVGDVIPPLTIPAITRSTLALYAGASGDHNPIHIDSDFARASGLDDVIAHGMLSMAYLGRMLTDWQSQVTLLSFNTRFTAVTHVHDVITCRGKVTDIRHSTRGAVALCEIVAEKANGEITLVGEATVALN